MFVMNAGCVEECRLLDLILMAKAISERYTQSASSARVPSGVLDMHAVEPCRLAFNREAGAGLAAYCAVP